MSIGNIQTSRQVTLNERTVGILIYLTGMATAMTFGHPYAWTVELPHAIGDAMIGAGVTLAIFGWRR